MNYTVKRKSSIPGDTTNKTHPCKLRAGSLPQVCATEMVGARGGMLGLRSEWLRFTKGFGPRADMGNLPRSPQARVRTLTPVAVQAWGGCGTGQEWASNSDADAGQKTERALLISREAGDAPGSSLLLPRENLWNLGEAGGDGALKGNADTECGFGVISRRTAGGLGSLL